MYIGSISTANSGLLMRNVLLFFILFVCNNCIAQDDVLRNILSQHPQQFDTILKNKERYRLQIVYTKIDRDKNNEPHFTTYYFDTARYYYYCASMVKLLECALAIEKINEAKSKHALSIYDSLVVSGDVCGDLNEAAYRKRGNFSTPAQLIKEMLLISNNHAFNPLYDFLGQAYFNKRAHQLGYNSAVIGNRLAACDSVQNRMSSSVLFFDRETGDVKYIQGATVNQDQPMVNGFNTVVGTGYMNGTNIDPPRDFKYNNYISLGDLHHLLINLIFPSNQSKSQKMHLKGNDYAFLRKYMGMYPSESVSPQFPIADYPDTHMKFFITPTDTFGHGPANIRAFNKVGQAYGFMTDCSYVVDTLNKVEFFISCSMYLNKDEILNDGVYEYDWTGAPFFRNLFNAVYQYELTRPRKHKPVLEQWDFSDAAF